MTKKARDKILAGLNDAIAFADGTADKSKYRVHIPPEIDVRAMRRRMKLTQEDFCASYGFTLARVRDWEQGRSSPDGAVRAYLLVIDRQPKAVAKALRVA